MSEKQEISIYGRDVEVRLEIVIPENYVWDFMKQFGETFAMEDVYYGVKTTKTVNEYYKTPNGWHIQISIRGTDEKEFHFFLKSFCIERSLDFKEDHF